MLTNDDYKRKEKDKVLIAVIYATGAIFFGLYAALNINSMERQMQFVLYFIAFVILGGQPKIYDLFFIGKYFNGILLRMSEKQHSGNSTKSSDVESWVALKKKWVVEIIVFTCFAAFLFVVFVSGKTITEVILGFPLLYLVLVWLLTTDAKSMAISSLKIMRQYDEDTKSSLGLELESDSPIAISES